MRFLNFFYLGLGVLLLGAVVAEIDLAEVGVQVHGDVGHSFD